LRSCYILDAGTGAGSMTEALSDNINAPVIGVDVNRQVFPHVYGKVDRKKVDFVACDFANLPLRESAFCCIVCDLVMSTSQNWHTQILKEFNRVLRAGSTLYITDYCPEETPRSRQDWLAAETRRLYKAVSELKRGSREQEFPPNVTIQWLKEAGFQNVQHERIEANESPEWKKRVFKEYYSNMKKEISDIYDPKLQRAFMNKLEKLRREIEANRTINWNWGVNYLIQASK